MGLADELEQAQGAKLWRDLCGVHKVMNAHPEEADIIFEFCTLRPDKTHAAVAGTLRAHGIELSASTINRHYRGLCKCAERMPERYR